MYLLFHRVLLLLLFWTGRRPDIKPNVASVGVVAAGGVEVGGGVIMSKTENYKKWEVPRCSDRTRT